MLEDFFRAYKQLGFIMEHYRKTGTDGQSAATTDGSIGPFLREFSVTLHNAADMLCTGLADPTLADFSSDTFAEALDGLLDQVCCQSFIELPYTNIHFFTQDVDVFGTNAVGTSAVEGNAAGPRGNAVSKTLKLSWRYVHDSRSLTLTLDIHIPEVGELLSRKKRRGSPESSLRTFGVGLQLALFTEKDSSLLSKSGSSEGINIKRLKKLVSKIEDTIYLYHQAVCKLSDAAVEQPAGTSEDGVSKKRKRSKPRVEAAELSGAAELGEAAKKPKARRVAKHESSDQQPESKPRSRSQSAGRSRSRRGRTLPLLDAVLVAAEKALGKYVVLA